MIKKKLQITYTAVFLALCAAPLACLPFAKSDDSAENRKLSEMPSLLTEEGKPNTDWPSQFETYFSEHFAFRNKLVTLDSMIKSEVFSTSSSEKVIVGDHGWLYFAETLGDYTGESSMTERKLYNTAKTVRLMQEHFENDGRKFLFFTSPNKSSVYPENMPARYRKSDSPSNRERLPEVFDELGVSYLDIAPIFTQSDHPLYLSRDSHWTNEGALAAYNAAADALDIPHADFSMCARHTETIWHADLDGMLFPSYERLSDQEIYDIGFTFDYAGSFTSEDDLLIKTKNDAAPGGNLLMYRDSFGRAFYPFAAENAKLAYFSRETPYKTSYADDVDAEAVIFEIVERNLGNITASAPVMTAPSREMDISASVMSSDKNICEISKNGRLFKIYGKLDEEYFTDHSDIYVTLESENAIYGFEAFPIYESSLMEDDNDSDYGFSLMLDKSEIPEGDYEIYAYITNGDKYICTNPLAELSIGE